MLPKKAFTCAKIYLVATLWADIFIAYIELNPTFAFLHQFYSGELAISAGRTTIFFFNIASIIPWFGQIFVFLRWTWLLLLLMYFFIDNRTWWYLLSSSFFPLSSSRSFRHLRFVGKLLSGVSSDFSMIQWVLVSVK